MTPRCILLLLAMAIMAVPELVSSQHCTRNNVLYSGESLFQGQSLVYGNFTLTMQTDCNLVVYDSNRPIWESKTAGRGSFCYALMQADGNFVVYNNNRNSVWASGTSRGSGNYILVLQKDGNVVIYGPGLLATGTSKLTGGAKNSTAAADADADAYLGNRKIAMVTEN